MHHLSQNIGRTLFCVHKIFVNWPFTEKSANLWLMAERTEFRGPKVLVLKNGEEEIPFCFWF